MTEEQFNAATDITPRFGCVTKQVDGKTVMYPVMQNAQAHLIHDGFWNYVDKDGELWFVFASDGCYLKRRA